MCTHMRVCGCIDLSSGQEGSSSLVEGVLGMEERGALLSVKRKVFFLQLFKVDMFTQPIYLKNIICISYL